MLQVYQVFKNQQVLQTKECLEIIMLHTTTIALNVFYFFLKKFNRSMYNTKKYVVFYISTQKNKLAT